MEAIGRTTRVIGEGRIPGWSHGPAPQLLGHETASLMTSIADAA